MIMSINYVKWTNKCFLSVENIVSRFLGNLVNLLGNSMNHKQKTFQLSPFIHCILITLVSKRIKILLEWRRNILLQQVRISLEKWDQEVCLQQMQKTH